MNAVYAMGDETQAAHLPPVVRRAGQQPALTRSEALARVAAKIAPPDALIRLNRDAGRPGLTPAGVVMEAHSHAFRVFQPRAGPGRRCIFRNRVREQAEPGRHPDADAALGAKWRQDSAPIRTPPRPQPQSRMIAGTDSPDWM